MLVHEAMVVYVQVGNRSLRQTLGFVLESVSVQVDVFMPFANSLVRKGSERSFCGQGGSCATGWFRVNDLTLLPCGCSRRFFKSDPEISHTGALRYLISRRAVRMGSFDFSRSSPYIQGPTRGGKTSPPEIPDIWRKTRKKRKNPLLQPF